MDYLYDLDCLIFQEYEIRYQSLRVLHEKNANVEYLSFEKSYEGLKTKLIEVFGKRKHII